MRKEQVIRDIVEATEKAGLSPETSYEGKWLWYSFAYDKGLLEYIYDKNGLVGFVDWIRLPRIPESMQDILNFVDWKVYKTAPVFVALNSVILRGWHTLKILKRKALYEKNRDCRVFAWHNHKTGKMRTFKRRGYGAQATLTSSHA